jgi:CheY-like chemotaxis protein
VLVVDDEQDIVELCRLLFELDGFEVDTASNGIEALDRARRSNPDLILLDVMMPVKDGWECLTELKSDPRLRDITVVMLSAKVQREHQLRALDGGASAYITKPFRGPELVGKVRELISA